MKSMGGADKPKLADSLNSFKKGGLDQNQKIRRNAYFEKLSQQLKELQGGSGSITPAEASPAKSQDNSNSVAKQVSNQEPTEEQLLESENVSGELEPRADEEQLGLVEELEEEIDAFLEEEEIDR
jgi:hypothetical protein